MTIYTNGPFNGSSNGTVVLEAANKAALPAGQTDGTLGIAQDTGVLYESRTGVWTAVVTIANSDNYASASQAGTVSTGAQTIAGVKTFSSTIVGSVNGNAATVTTNANLTGDVTSSGNATTVAKIQGTTISGAAVAATGSTLALRDSQGNAIFNNSISSSTNTVSSGQTINLTSGSARIQTISGSANVTFNLPDATSLTPTGWTFEFGNSSTGTITINKHDGSTLVETVSSNNYSYIVCSSNSTSNGSWLAQQLVPSILTASVAVFTDANSNLVSKAVTGTGNVALATAPTLSNPVVGTQTQGDSSTKAASTAYVDVAVANAVAGVNPAVAVQAATTAASDTSSYTYSNGVAGIGATLTGPNNTALTVDGFTFTAVNQRILVKNDTQSPSGAYNGVYYVGTLQGASQGVILIRALDYNTPSDINNTGAIPVVNGTVNGTTMWVLTSSVATVGTSPLTYTKFSRNPADYLLVSNNLSDVGAKATSFNNLSPMTTNGDVIYGAASGAGTRLAIGTQYQSLQAGASIPAYDAVHLDQSAAVTGTLPTGKGGTGVASVTTAPAASSFAGWDANSNLSANNHIEGFTTTATAAGTTTMTIASTYTQVWTGSTTQTVKLPTTSVVAGGSYLIINNSTGVVTVQSSGANTILAMAANTQALFTSLVATPTTAANWNYSYQLNTNTIPVTNPMTTGGDVIYGGASGVQTRLANGSSGQYLKSAGTTSAPTWGSFTAPTVQKFTSGSAQTYTTPTSPAPLYIRVRMSGGGGGGGGSQGSSGAGGVGSNGNNTTFGSSLLTANGGTGSSAYNAGGAGGSFTVGGSAIDCGSFSGGTGGGGGQVSSTGGYDVPGYGGDNSFGGKGVPGAAFTAGGNGVTNTGAGGAGGSSGNNSATQNAGGGGGAGGFVDAIITSPSATYTYTVGTGGGGGTAGTGGNSNGGGNGAAGIIIVYEYYQ